jgi:hypothetical protein
MKRVRCHCDACGPKGKEIPTSTYYRHARNPRRPKVAEVPQRLRTVVSYVLSMVQRKESMASLFEKLAALKDDVRTTYYLLPTTYYLFYLLSTI